MQMHGEFKWDFPKIMVHEVWVGVIFHDPLQQFAQFFAPRSCCFFRVKSFSSVFSFFLG